MKFLLAVVFMMKTGITLAQSGINAGGVAGVNIANFAAVENAPKYNSRMGFYAGVNLQKTWFKYEEVKQTVVGAELLFSQHGAGSAQDETYTLSYLSLAPLVHFYPGESPVYITSGFSAAYLIHAAYRVPGAAERDITGSMRKMDFGGVLGAGYDIGEKLTINARWLRGFTALDRARLMKSSSVVRVGIAYSF